MQNKKKKEDHQQGDKSGNLLTSDYIYNPNHTIKELAEIWKISEKFLIGALTKLGIKNKVHQCLTRDLIELLGLKFNINIIDDCIVNEEFISQVPTKDLITRSPIVTIMGHVDHGKTTLLDVIRKTRVVDQEAGGITQKIGAYEVVYNGKKITFIDSPGHEAFTKMRSRGAQITDICVLVVACDDGVKAQTLESVKHAQKAKVDIIIALNKIDKIPNQKERIMSELSEYNLIPKEWGGDTFYIEISALKTKGIDNLLETILLVNNKRPRIIKAQQNVLGTVLEASLIKNKGSAATVIINQGILKIGDIVVAGHAYGKVRALENDIQEKIQKCFPSQPVVIYGFKQVPQAGDLLMVATNEKIAKQIIEIRQQKSQEKKHQELQKNLEQNFMEELLQENVSHSILNFILKTDTQGMIEVITESLKNLDFHGVKINFIKTATGALTDNDIMLASTFQAIIINFNNLVDQNIIKLADNLKVEVRSYQILYRLVEDIAKKLKTLSKPIFQLKFTGKAVVIQVFYRSDKNNIAGCRVINGVIYNGASVQVKRQQKIIYQGKIVSLKHLKNNIDHAKTDSECGIVFDNFNDFRMDDIIEASRMEEIVNE
ncbi:MAG: translation initiation factor IF-2 [Candidatus Phytoplasma australasiaticum]|uniref:Translation initiation factor IF-2 n=4 Tax=Candidatus Phytoplasma TaxID=33926 RepID=A0A9K3ST98_9MOLU|nr:MULTISPECIES: translation initiation factor IF-2 [Phytoplasma]QLL37066.1 translation initiation factor IF-2 ['Echinacea purpurea' witches'-broom phytoplasma]WEX20611.1 MAG: translation initiation factor IF-2 [Candidatus Phytoplasma aurantifolia]EMR14517.1 translation initiation factor IF-2 [Peanut witches'-broom phytoplasma NTU2011]MCG3566520.1 translation initiation factor IF-2 [Sesame phyllody phytoplasma]MDO8030916.1 translation initiation factor IF-2 [Candidatus Phytoplasma australasiat